MWRDVYEGEDALVSTATVANCKADRNCNDSSYSIQWCASNESTLASACGIRCFILP